MVGPNPLNPVNIAWLQGLDPIQHYLGWVFYRQGPWTVPLGLSPDFGLDISASIVYVDSIPLLAILFKPFAPILPKTFQYFGIWLWLCFILQAIFAWKLISLITPDRITCLLASGLLLFSPILLYRVGVHSSLVGQFIILWALYLCFKPSKKIPLFWWLALLSIAILVHFYLFTIALGLWFSNIYLHVFSLKTTSIKKVLFELTAVLLWIIFLAWQAGYFLMGGSALGAGAYGIGRMNLLAPINSNGWSYVLPSIPNTLAAYESFDFFGLGALFLILVAVPILIKQHIKIGSLLSRQVFLISLMILFTLFAITNQIGFGSLNFTIPIPHWLFSIASILRASARLFWPVFYILILGAIYLLVRFHSKRTALIFLCFGFFIQILDTSAGWWPMRQKITKDSLGVDALTVAIAPLADPFWENAAKQYRNVLVVPAQDPPGKIPYDWSKYATYAAKNKMATNSVYLARVDADKLKSFHQQFETMTATGQYDPRSLYILGDEKLLPVLMHLNSQTDLLARINNVNILAPGWKTCSSCPQVPKSNEIMGAIPKTTITEKILFSNQGIGKNFLVGVGAWPIVGWGWSYPESFGVWSEGDHAKLTIPLPQDASGLLAPVKGIKFEMRALVTPEHPQQQLDLWVNGEYQKTFILKAANDNQIEVSIPKSSKDYVAIELKLPNKIKPQDLGLGSDTRELSVGIIQATWY